MRVVVRLHGELERFYPDGARHLEVDLPEGATVADLLQRLAPIRSEIWRASVGGVLVSTDYGLKDGQTVILLAPIGGGC